MKIILIGHRGAGKTRTTDVIRSKFHMKVVDLDFYIEQQENKSIKEIFEDHGEAHFRKLELKYFSLLNQSNDNFLIALGAGFELEQIQSVIKNEFFQIIWIRRLTDKLGRIFLNRPSLDKNLSALDSYKVRFAARESRYLRYSTHILTIPEGHYNFEFVQSFFEKIIMRQQFSLSINWLTTLTLKNYKQVFAKDNIEIRTDLVSFDFFKEIQAQLQDKSYTLSIRKVEDYTFWMRNTNAIQIDWAIELGELPKDINNRITIISFHEAAVDRLQDIRRQYPDKHIKWSPMVDGFFQLDQYENIVNADGNMSFLPRSESGRWSWYRLLRSAKQKINFYKVYDESAKDQPCEFEVFYYNQSYEKNAAVIGSPIEHSFSPQFHYEFFRKNNKNFFKIEIFENEFNETLKFLVRKNFKFFAITSPLKTVACNFVCDQNNQAKKNYSSINTLVITSSEYQSTNTDVIGFKKLIGVCENKLKKSLENLSVQVWGGGGVLGAIELICPNAEFVSVRSGLVRKNKVNPNSSVDVLIWAGAPFERLPEYLTSVECVVDLNYVDWSMARELSIKHNSIYISGLDMFEQQAKEQQSFYLAQCEDIN